MKIKRYNEFITESTEYGTRDQIFTGLNKMDIKNYSINDDLSVNVDGDVDISGKNLTEVPIKFNDINGDFYCSHNQLTSLEFCPQSINGDFLCSHNQLTSLLGMPINYDLNNLLCNNNSLNQSELIGNGLETIISENETNITYHIDGINKNKDLMPEEFNEKFGYLLEFEHYTKTLNK